MSRQPGVITAAGRELRRIGGRPLYPLLIIILPLLSCAVLLAIFGAGTVRELPVTVVDQDASPLSRQLGRMLDASPGLSVEHRLSDVHSAERLLLEGRVYASILIPRGLERDLLRGEAPAVVCLRNSQLLLPASLVRRDVLAVVGTLSAGLEVRVREARGEAEAAAIASFEPIRVDRHALFNPWLNYVYFLVSSLLPTMLQIFVTVAVVHAVGVELKEGSGREWLASAGGSVTKAVLGKLLPYTVGYLAVAGFMATVILRDVGVPLRGDLATVVAGTTLFVLAYEGIAVMLAAWFASLRFATSAAAFIATPAFAFVGLTFPTMAMPPVARGWGALLPLSHYLRLMIEQLMRGAPSLSSVPELAALAGFVVAAPLLSRRRLAHVITDPRYWGRS